MFYATQIKSVDNGYAIDVHGRTLSFIGYLPVKAGDTVYTDGKVIFGNAPHKGAPLLAVEQSGIPVLSDDLRGYFTSHGRYKQYQIAGDDWIVNGKKTYTHDNGEENIIDAEIARDADGNETGIYTVEKVITQLAQDDEDYHWGQYYTTIMTQGSGAKAEYYRTYGEFYGTFVELEDDDFTDTWIYENFPAERIRYDIEAYCDYDYGYPANVRGMRKYMFFMRGSDLDFRKADNQVLKKCELVIRLDEQEVERINIADLLTELEDTAKAEIDVLQDHESIKHLKSRANLCNFKILSDGTWEALIDAEIWAVNSVLSTGYDDSFRTTRAQYFSTTSHNRLLIRVDSSGNITTPFKWNWIRPLILTDSAADGYYPESDYSFVETSTGYVEQTYVTETTYGYVRTTFTCYDARKIKPELDYNKKNLEIADDFDFPVQDDYQANIANVDEEIDKWQLGGVYDKGGNKIIGELSAENAHKWNMSLAPLKNGGYLFGIRKDADRDIDGKLYKIDSGGNIEQVGDGLKNFRLRELKRISKAKK